MLTRLDYRPNDVALEGDYISSFEEWKTVDARILAEKPNVRTLRILFYETKQGDAPSPGLLNFHKSPWGKLERCDCQFFFRDSGPENLSWYYDHVSCLG